MPHPGSPSSPLYAQGCYVQTAWSGDSRWQLNAAHSPRAMWDGHKDGHEIWWEVIFLLSYACSIPFPVNTSSLSLPLSSPKGGDCHSLWPCLGHMSPVTDFRSFFGSPVKITHMTSKNVLYSSHAKGTYFPYSNSPPIWSHPSVINFNTTPSLFHYSSWNLIIMSIATISV